MHEASLHERNCFWTCTYADEHLRDRRLSLVAGGAAVGVGSCRADDGSAFVKRLRDRVKPLRFRFQFKTEYGPQTLRPHIHGIFFGLDFADRVVFRRTDAGELSYVSELLTDAWGMGHCECSDLTPRSAGYVANHNVDKLDGELGRERYSRLDVETGEIFEVEPETVRMSNRPGIGAGWLSKFEGDCFPKGFLVSEGNKVSVPRYYGKRLKGRFELRASDAGAFVPVDDAEVMRRKARARAREPQVVWNSTPERLAVREECLRLKVERLRRDAI